MFKVGQKVVCVDGSPPADSLVAKGCIYTIEEIRENPAFNIMRRRQFAHGIGFHLHEVKLDDQHWLDASRFRPIVERKTDISFAHEILRKTTKRAPLSAIKGSANVL